MVAERSTGVAIVAVVVVAVGGSSSSCNGSASGTASERFGGALW